MPEERQGHASIVERQAALEKMYPSWEKRTIATHFHKQCQQYSDDPLIMMPDPGCNLWRNVGAGT